MKKVLTTICALVLTCSFLPSASAAEPDREIIDLGDGFYAVVTLTQLKARASGKANGVKSCDVYYGATLVGTMTVGGVFEYDGTSSKATQADVTGSGANGWTYSRGATHISGNMASGTAFFSNGSVITNCTISIFCDPDGNLS